MSAIAIRGTLRFGATAVSPTAAYTASTTATRLTALEFEVPWTMCSGTQPISVTVRPSSAAPGLSGYTASRTMTASFDPQSALRLIRMRVRDDHYGLPAPSPADWATSAQGARERFPVAEDGIIVATAPGWEEFGTDRDLNAKDGWEDLLDDIDDIADDFTDIGQVWTATVPNSDAYKLNGLAHAPFDRIWPLDDDYRACVSRVTNRASCAHEIAHTFGIAHSPGGGPDDPDMSLPPMLESDVIGWRASDDTTFPPGWSDLMSYLTPSGGTYQDRWPSAELWNRLFDRLN